MAASGGLHLHANRLRTTSSDLQLQNMNGYHDDAANQEKGGQTVASRPNSWDPPPRTRDSTDEKWPTVSGSLPFLGAPLPKIGERLRLFAGFYEIGRESQAVCTFVVHSRKLRKFQAFRTAILKMADSLRLFALFGRSITQNWGTSQAVRTFS